MVVMVVVLELNAGWGNVSQGLWEKEVLQAFQQCECEGVFKGI
jgi:hypothetical protein